MTRSAATPKGADASTGLSVTAAGSLTEPPVAADSYHRDDFHDGPPSLSASLAHTLITRSPLHAKAQHPRLNPDYEREEDPKFDIGRVAHQVLLEGNRNIVVVPEDSWRTKAAQTARNEAWRVHMTALLEKDWERVLEMVSSVQEQLAGLDIDPIPFTVGRPEVALSWSEPNGTHCRALVDWIHDGNLYISDLKTTRVSANPEAWCRNTLWSIGADIQVAANTRAVEAVYGVTPEFRYVVVETEPPFALSVVSLAPSALELGRAKWNRAVQLWGQCLAVGEWPSYPDRVVYAELPAWEEVRWLEKEAREAA